MIRFYNAKIMSMENGTDITQGELWVKDDKIEYIGPPKKDISSEKFFRQIDLKGDLLMPGFKNAHTHSAMSILRSFADDLPLQTWLNERIFPLEAKLTADDIHKATKLAVLEYLSNGITAAFDMYYEPEAYTSACIDMGFRSVLCGAINNFKESPEALEEYYIKYNSLHPLISYQLGFHAEYTTGLERLSAIGELSRKHKAPVYAHISETKTEVDGCIERYGKTPAELFDSLGMLEHGGGGFHGVYLSENDRRIFKDRRLYIITNPASNL
ncbi:MAG: amidohydrolase family protein, partial [Firmicutes bacterium]|nr:amidohydrolase family protein [Bacillota bacterium]